MGLLKIFLYAVLVIVILILGVGFYLYNFHVFKTIRVCISETEIENTDFSCTEDIECVNELSQRAPKFLADKLLEADSGMVYCRETCQVKKVYGDISGEGEECKPEDKEILVEIRGKDALAFVKSANQLN